MTATVSFLPMPSPQNAGEAKVTTPAAEKNSAAAPFSRMLDHAVRETPGRKNKPAQSERPAPKESKAASTDKTDRAETKLESQPRQPRVKSSKRDREEADPLAGAGSVTAPATPMPPEEPVAANVDSGDAPVTATAADGQGADGETAVPASEAMLKASDKTTAGSGLDVTALITPTESVTEDNSLLNSLTPATTTAFSSAESSAVGSKSAEPPLLQTGTEFNPAITDATTTALTEISLEQSQIGSPKNFIPPTFTPDAGLATTTAKSAAVTEVAEAGPTPAATVPPAAVAAAEGPSATPDSVPEELRRSVRAVRRARLEALEAGAGIGSAKSSETMKTATKKEELAGGAEQFLPVSSPTALSALRNLPGELNRKVAGQVSALDATDVAKTTAAPAHGATGPDTETLFVRSNSPMTRISEVVSREIRMFKRGGDDLVEVVLTPDTKTQISLRLQWREGQVEVQARCDLGDYQSLSTQWPQLQASLANHGVRLSHLSERAPTGFTEFFNNPSFAQQQGRDERSQHPAGNAEALPSLPAPAVKPGVAPVVRRGNGRFDSWA